MSDEGANHERGPLASPTSASEEAARETDEHGREFAPAQGSEAETLLGFLETQRGTLRWKAGGLDAAQLSTTLPPSELTLGGLLKHMVYVEDQWFSRVLHDRPAAPPWDTVDWKADRDWDWHSAADDSPEQLYGMWEAAVAKSRADVQEALDARGLAGLALRDSPEGRPSLRWILTHMIEEYARHVGHADLIRESIDGLVGE